MAALTGAVRQRYTIRDHKGNNAHVSLYLNSTYTTLAAGNHGFALANDIYALQTGNTKLDSTGVTPSVQANGAYNTVQQPWTGTFNSAGDYLTVEDKAQYVFTDAVGGIHRYQIAAPVASQFLADQDTIDQSQGAVKQFVADMLASTFAGTAPNAFATKAVVNASNQPLVAFLGGFRERRRQQRRFNIFTRNPSLSGPGL